MGFIQVVDHPAFNQIGDNGHPPVIRTSGLPVRLISQKQYRRIQFRNIKSGIDGGAELRRAAVILFDQFGNPGGFSLNAAFFPRKTIRRK